jgi:TPR repeat protein
MSRDDLATSFISKSMQAAREFTGPAWRLSQNPFVTMGANDSSYQGLQKKLVKKISWVATSALLALAATIFVSTSCSKTLSASPTISASDIEGITAQAEKGDAEAQKRLGTAYSKGQGVKQDYQQASKWYRRAADQGNAAAQTALGELYEAGQGVPHDDVQAGDWYRRAAEQGYSGAQYNLAALYAVGKGVPMSNSEALKWYLQAAGQGDPLAQYNVGMRYMEARGVKQDPAIAYKWLSLAAAQRLPDAAQALETLKSRLSSEQLAKGRELVKQFKLAGATNR